MLELTNEQIVSYAKRSVVGLFVATTMFSSFNYNEGGVVTRVQSPFTGFKWVKEEGYYGKVPFLSKTKSFNKNGTVAATKDEGLKEASGKSVSPTLAMFADAYEMEFEWSLRYELPSSDEELEYMYGKLKSQENMLSNTIMPFAQTMFTDSVNQMLGGDYAQGGKNTLRTLVDNQSQYGMYQTKVVKQTVKRGTGEGSNSVLGGAGTDLEITKVVYLKDKNGKRLRTPLSIMQYGIKVVPNSFQIIENTPKGRLVEYIATKQSNQRKQIEQDELQKILAKESQTEQLQGEKDLITRTNALNIRKQEAIIAKQQQVEEAQLQAEKEKIERQKIADLAIIDKERELQIAKANEGIQKANASAAKYEAKAIKEVGFAQAEVESAKLKAKQSNKEIYIAELNMKTTIKQAEYMTKTKLTMPKTVIVNGENNGNNTTSDLLNVKLINDVTRQSNK